VKWYKHMTNAMNDLFIRDLETEFGDAGYVFWFKTLELIGSQGDDGKMDISETVWRQVIHSRRTDHLRRLYAFATQRGKLEVESLSNGLLRVKCAKFAEYSDNFTKYQKPLQSNFKVTLKQEEDKKKNRIEEDKSTKILADSYYKICDILYSKMLINDSKAKKPDYEKWVKEIDALIRIDKRTEKEITDVIDFCQSDSF